MRQGCAIEALPNHSSDYSAPLPDCDAEVFFGSVASFSIARPGVRLSPDNGGIADIPRPQLRARFRRFDLTEHQIG